MRLVSASCLLLVSIVAVPALAQPGSALRFGALRSDARTLLTLDEEVLELECEAPATPAEPMPCTFRARYALSSPAPDATSPALRFTVENGEGFQVGDAGGTGTTDAPVLSTQRFPFAPGASRTLVLSGQAAIEPLHDQGPQPADALSARHPLLVTSMRTEERGFIYSRALTRHFASAPDAVVIRARLPAGYRIAVEGGASGEPRLLEDGWTELSVHRPGDETDPDIRVLVRRGDSPVLRNGGVFLALGGVVLTPNGMAPANVFWARLGYEIGFSDFLITSLAVETDFTRRMGLSLMIEAGSPSFGLPPSLSAGVGGLLRLLSETGEVTGGLRLAVGTVVYSVGFEAMFDVFPVDGGFTITLLGRAGL